MSNRDKAKLAELRRQIIAAGDLLDIGKAGEAIIAALHPEWERAKPCNKAWDFNQPSHRGMIQVKTQAATSRRTYYAIKPGADWLIVVEINQARGEWEIKCDCPIAAADWKGYRDKTGRLAWRCSANRIAA
jgi:hypothetical protein